jgi:hypothetical protein
MTFNLSDPKPFSNRLGYLIGRLGGFIIWKKPEMKKVVTQYLQYETVQMSSISAKNCKLLAVFTHAQKTKFIFKYNKKTVLNKDLLLTINY